MSSVLHYIVWLIILMNTDGTSVSYNQPKIGPNATWCKNGTTFLDHSTMGGPVRGIFVDYNDTVYVAAQQKSQILVWSEESVCLVRNLTVKLPEFTTLFVTMNGDIYFENGSEEGRVDKWTTNSTNSIVVAKFSGQCFGLFVDINSTLYCSILSSHRVVKMSLNEKNSTEITVAGTGISAKASDQLNRPWGIFVDTNFDLYVADADNHRIQLFRPGERNGTTLAGYGIPQGLSLLTPTDVVLDADRLLYIADNRHNRVIRLRHDGFECVIGCSGTQGSAPNQLLKAYSLHFDTHGNMYVADEFNNRIQRFSLGTDSCELFRQQSNKSHSRTSVTTMSTFDYITISSSSIIQIISTPEHSTSSPSSFTCSNAHGIGPYCNISNTPCDMLEPCQNNATCNNINTVFRGYLCLCPLGFDGSRCEIDNRPCTPTTCWNNGTCYETSNTTFNCSCELGWEGTQGERKVNHCQNVICENRGVCQPLFRNYTCQCLGNNFYIGDHCEIRTNKILILNIVSKSFGYIGYLALIIFAMFIIIMDILKYCFGIDLTRKELEQIRREKLAKKRKHLIQRFIYVNAPPSSETPNPTVEEATV